MALSHNAQHMLLYSARVILLMLDFCDAWIMQQALNLSGFVHYFGYLSFHADFEFARPDEVEKITRVTLLV